MNVFNKLKFFYATCHFCHEKGLCLEAKNDNGTLPVCEECSRKLIIGITTALEELKRMNDSENVEVSVEGAEVKVEEVAPAEVSVEEAAPAEVAEVEAPVEGAEAPVGDSQEAV